MYIQNQYNGTKSYEITVGVFNFDDHVDIEHSVALVRTI